VEITEDELNAAEDPFDSTGAAMSEDMRERLQQLRDAAEVSEGSWSSEDDDGSNAHPRTLAVSTAGNADGGPVLKRLARDSSNDNTEGERYLFTFQKRSNRHSRKNWNPRQAVTLPKGDRDTSAILARMRRD
jgi:hypothetical protein